MEFNQKNAAAYRVFLEDIKRDIETVDSFAIKFGLLTHTPVTKIKYMLRSLPTIMWEGVSRATALSILSYIEDAGGKGRVDELDPANPDKVDLPEGSFSNEAGSQGTCPKCGFPVDKDDEYCQFCMSPLNEKVKHKIADFIGVSKSRQIIPSGRLRLYILIIVGVLILDLLARL